MPTEIQRNLGALIELIPLATLLFSADGKLVGANPLAQRMLKVSAYEDIHVSYFYPSIISIDDKPFVKSALPFNKVIKTSKPVRNSLIAMHLGHRKTIIRVDGAPFNYGEKVYVILTCVEVSTEHKQQVAQKHFIKLIGHELKQPLTLIKTYTYLLRRQLKKKSDIELTRKIDSKTQIVARMLDDISNHARFSLSSFKLSTEPTQLSTLLTECIHDAKLLSDTHTFSCEISPDLVDAQFELDPVKIKQVITNLLSNATKYSATGTKIRAQLQSKGKKVILSVIDEGEGIPEAELELITEAYYRSSRKGKKKAKGLGLGLAFTRRILEKHDIELDISSEVKKGTTVSLVFLPKHFIT